MIAVSRRQPMLKPRAAEVAEPKTKKSIEKVPAEGENPGTGRSTKMGRRAETPASIRSSGPSGQTGRAQHQKKHPNK